MRFDYIKYDEVHQERQEAFKKKFEELEAMAGVLVESKAKSLFITKLEETYMWAGKAIRDNQIVNNSNDYFINNTPEQREP